MSLIPFDTLPDDSRLWCFGASRAPDASRTELLLDSMRAFVSEWTAHRSDLQAGFDWLHGRFLLIGVDESGAGASGCSIDALTGHLKRLGAVLKHPTGARGAIRIVEASGEWGRRNFARWMFEDEPRAIATSPRRWHRDFLARPGAYTDR